MEGSPGFTFGKQVAEETLPREETQDKSTVKWGVKGRRKKTFGLKVMNLRS